MAAAAAAARGTAMERQPPCPPLPGGQSFTVRVPEWALSAAIAGDLKRAVPAALAIAAKVSARAGWRRPKRSVAESNPSLEPQSNRSPARSEERRVGKECR